MQNKVAVIGSSDFVMPYSAIGFDIFSVESSTAARKAAEEIAGGGYALVIVAETVAPELEEIFAPLEKKAIPCIVIVPFTSEPSGYAVKQLGKTLKLATGVDILGSIQ